ncbi:hypothetical protein P3T35_007308 [Kitasatospora sp. GP30]|nr:hypothetical protein [Kitasatospora sp. GP30]
MFALRRPRTGRHRRVAGTRIDDGSKPRPGTAVATAAVNRVGNSEFGWVPPRCACRLSVPAPRISHRSSVMAAAAILGALVFVAAGQRRYRRH